MSFSFPYSQSSNLGSVSAALPPPPNQPAPAGHANSTQAERRRAAVRDAMARVLIDALCPRTVGKWRAKGCVLKVSMVSPTELGVRVKRIGCTDIPVPTNSQKAHMCVPTVDSTGQMADLDAISSSLDLAVCAALGSLVMGEELLALSGPATFAAYLAEIEEVLASVAQEIREYDLDQERGGPLEFFFASVDQLLVTLPGRQPLLLEAGWCLLRKKAVKKLIRQWLEIDTLVTKKIATDTFKENYENGADTPASVYCRVLRHVSHEKVLQEIFAGAGDVPERAPEVTILYNKRIVNYTTHKLTFEPDEDETEIDRVCLDGRSTSMCLNRDAQLLVLFIRKVSELVLQIELLHEEGSFRYQLEKSKEVWRVIPQCGESAEHYEAFKALD